MDNSILDPSHGGYIAVSQQGVTLAQVAGSPPPSPAVSDSVFSATSEASSQSSIGDSPEETTACSQQLAAPIKTQHPRRTASSTTAPPSLPRQEERKVLFVNDLVDSATSLVSNIWPNSEKPICNLATKGQVLPLRRYIEETLRRSRTSYSTLQVALYYLVLIKDYMSRYEQDSPELRMMCCGRRMFLSALILASKYLQDRNYSAKAWSKMSGLKTTEINSNERIFLAAVDWRLHISDEVFKRWTDIVLRFTAPPASATPAHVMFDSRVAWAQVMPLLTPSLDDPAIMTLQIAGGATSGMLTPGASPPPAVLSYSAASSPEDTTTPLTICPRVLEPRPDMLPPTPGLARMCRLPTPLMTPSVYSGTPAASASSSRRPSISMAMAQAQCNMFNRMTLDGFATPAFTARAGSVRFPSVAPSTSTCLSPESMVTDRTRSSRSSSIGSFAVLAGAPKHATACPATSQPGVEVINLDLVQTKGTAEHPIVLDSPETICLDAPEVTLRTNKKRTHSAYSSDEQLRADVQALLLQNEALDLTSYECPRVSPRSAALAPQPPAALHKARLPVSQGNGRKRVCSSIESAEPDIMDVDSVWADVL